MPLNDTDTLDAKLLAAHRQGARAELVQFYTDAADLADAEGQINAACFYLTHAYVFALETGDRRAVGLHDRLRQYGREE